MRIVVMVGFGMLAAVMLPPAAHAVCDCREKVCLGSLRPGDDILQLLDDPSGHASPPPARSLFLSGGGSHGAWGAGVLYGRRQREGGIDHEFDLITGVSTGALMATLAFIGDYDEMRKIFTKVKESDVQEESWYTRIFEGGLYSRKPLRKLVKCTLQNKFAGKTRLAHVKEQGERGRRLLVGTVDLDSGDFCVWNMACIASQGNDERYIERYIDVVMASANAPAIGPPVELDDGLHVDGGVRAQIFAQRAEFQLFGPEAYFLVNGKVEGGIERQPEGWVKFPKIVPFAVRGLEILEHEAMTMVLRYYHELIGARKSDPPVDRHVYVSRIPEREPLGFRKRDFPTDKMADLFQRGCRWGSSMDPWPEWRKGELDLPAPGEVPPPGGQGTDACKVDAVMPKQLCTPDS